ncbi:Sugar phosphate isomerase/epimerase [Micromonospora nigra]|uniref:Sugar phosphate isomerase/epimerase n=1 Tax=Micromonospora nigra TaxID=145857 RepID=A0A1C6SID4_9ACTN|nr:TIM barrel protein [Micromonospora nigra]SCL29246.1 Sugar phosphate isomerase/epimerase [Micromonospora nigra]
MTLRPGLVSVTFRQLTPAEVVALAQPAGLRGIEWGGDVHVPAGDDEAARRVAALTAGAGLETAAYGSYYRLGHSAAEGLSPESVVRTAELLGAPVVRVWAGRRPSSEADAAYRASVVEDARRIADLAGAVGLTIAFEYHRDTLTDTRESTARLLEAVADLPIRTLWQPQPERDRAENLADLRAVLPYLANLHVFAWTPQRRRLPLRCRYSDWAAYLAVARTAPGQRYAMLEFLVDDDPDLLGAEAATLRRLLADA